jgi:hypothetical protein
MDASDSGAGREIVQRAAPAFVASGFYNGVLSSCTERFNPVAGKGLAHFSTVKKFWTRFGNGRPPHSAGKVICGNDYFHARLDLSRQISIIRSPAIPPLSHSRPVGAVVF